MKEQLYKKVFIHSEEDLPKEDGVKLDFFDKNLLKINSIAYKQEHKDVWLNCVRWYYQPIEQLKPVLVKCAKNLPESIKEQANDYSNKGEYYGCRQASYFGFLRGAMAMSQFCHIEQPQPEKTAEEILNSAIKEYCNGTYTDMSFGGVQYSIAILAINKALFQFKSQSLPKEEKTECDSHIFHLIHEHREGIPAWKCEKCGKITYSM